MAKLVHNVQKKQHRERSQPQARSRWGQLQKHKDYSLRAKDYHRKETTLKLLREKARERNPDEYYRGMHSQKIDPRTGTLLASRAGQDEDSQLSQDQVKLLKTQDANYVRTMKQQHAKSLERDLKTTTFGHKGSHTIFVDSKQELRDFEPHKHFNTTPELLRAAESDPMHNRLTIDQLASTRLPPTLANAHKKKLRSLHRTASTAERERKLAEVLERMETQHNAMAKGSKKKITDSSGKKTYLFRKQRKR